MTTNNWRDELERSRGSRWANWRSVLEQVAHEEPDSPVGQAMAHIDALEANWQTATVARRCSWCEQPYTNVATLCPTAEDNERIKADARQHFLTCSAHPAVAAKEQAEQENAALRKALEDVRTDYMGTPCWCSPLDNLVRMPHSAVCMTAHRLLAAVPLAPTKGGGMSDSMRPSIREEMAEMQAMLAKEKERVATLEGVLRKLHADSRDEVEQSINLADIEECFECAECLDTGVVGGMPRGDENDSCCARCQRGNPYAPAPKKPERIAPQPIPRCHARDPHSPRICTLPKGHPGEHKDATFDDITLERRNYVYTDREWP